MSVWLLAIATASVLPTVRVTRERPIFQPQPQVVRLLSPSPMQDRLPEALKSVGYFGKNYGATGGLTTASLRGSGAEGVHVELDGIRLNSPLNGQADLGKISLLGIGKLELENGPGPEQALGGSLRLQTKEPLESLLGFGVGSFGETRLRAQIGQENLSLALSRESATNDYSYPYRGIIERRNNANITSTNLFAKGKQRWQDVTFRPLVLFSLREQAVPGAVNFPSPHASQEDVSLLAGLSLEGRPQPETLLTFSLSENLERQRFQDPDATLIPKQSALGVDATDARIDYHWETPLERHFPKISLGLRQDRTNGAIAKSQDHYSLRLRDEWWNDWGLLDASLGADHFSTIGGALSPKIGWSRTDGAIRTRASLGSAFRAPTFNELFWPEDSFSKGNPQIRPERVHSLELGGDGKWGPIQTSLTVYGQLGQDQIQWQPTDGKWTPINLTQTIGYGTEFEGSYLQASHSILLRYNHCSITSEGKQLVGRPLEQISLEGQETTPFGKYGGDISYVSSRFTTAANTESLPAYCLLGLSAEWKLAERTLAFRIDNLLDSPYQTVPYYPMPGRTFRLTLLQPL